MTLETKQTLQSVSVLTVMELARFLSFRTIRPRWIMGSQYQPAAEDAVVRELTVSDRYTIRYNDRQADIIDECAVKAERPKKGESGYYSARLCYFTSGDNHPKTVWVRAELVAAALNKYDRKVTP